jgi:6,7-dimethyl-8-ribityllumazine synthase
MTSGISDGVVASSRFAIVCATFYEDLAQRLTDGAVRALDEHGVPRGNVDVHEVAGAFELPLAAKACAQSGRYIAVICVGAVIRGETDHYDYVCEAAAHGIERAQLDTGVPCAFGVLTVESMDQALARAGGDTRDQGYNAANAAYSLALMLRQLQHPDEMEIAPGRMR